MKSVIYIVFYILVFIYFLHPISPDGDFFHHVNTGKFIVENHGFPYLDTYSFTAVGHPWIAHSWGMGLIFYFVYSVFGDWGISIFVSLIAVVTLILLRILLKLIMITDLTAGLLMFLAAVGLSIRFPSRPEIISYPFMVAILLINQAARKNSRVCIFYPLVILLWANLYGSGVLLGIIMILFIFISNIFSGRINRVLIFWVMLSILCAFLNPNGYKSLFYLFLIPRVITRQGEWAGLLTILKDSPADYLYLYQNMIIAYLSFLAVFVIVLVLNVRSLAKHKFYTLLSLYVFIPFYAFRYSPHVILLSIPLLAFIFSDMGRIRKKVFSGIILFVGLMMFFLVFPLYFPKKLTSFKYFPKYSVEFIKDRGLKGKIFTNQRLGAYISYKLYPENRVFIDTRDDLYLNTDVLDDFSNLLEYSASGKENIVELLDRYQVDVVLGDYLSDGLSMRSLFYDTRWVPVYFTDRYFVAVPVKTAKELNLPVLGAIDPYSINLSKPGMEKEAYRQYKETFGIYNNPANNLFLAKIYYSEGDYDQALARAERIETVITPEGNIDEMGKNNLLAQIYLAKMDCPNTYKYLKKLEDQTKNAFIFHPGRVFPSDIDQGMAFYYLLCRKEVSTARKFLDKYLKQPFGSVMEKARSRIRFEEMVKVR